jgi:hypothetical protein
VRTLDERVQSMNPDRLRKDSPSAGRSTHCVGVTDRARLRQTSKITPLRSASTASTVWSFGVVDRRRDATRGYAMGVGRYLARFGKRAWLGALAGILLAACSSGGDSTSTSNAPAPPTTVDSTSTSSATTAPTSIDPTTSSESPAPTTDATASAESNVRAAIDLAQQTFSECLVAMPNCDPNTLAVARGGDLLSRNVGRIGEWNSAGYTVIDRDRFRYVIESVKLNDDESQATAVVCIADGSKLVQPGAGPGGANVIVDDAYTSGRSSWDMRLDPDGQWRAYDAPAAGPTESTDVCPPA